MTESYEQQPAAKRAVAAPEANLPAVARRLPVAVAVTLLATTALLAGVLVLLNQADWWRGLLAAAVVSALAAGISVLPMTWGLRRDLHKAAAGFMAAIGVRMLVSLGGCMLAVLAGGYPPLPTLTLMMAFYLAVLAVETWLMASTLWPADAATTNTTTTTRP